MTSEEFAEGLDSALTYNKSEIAAKILDLVRRKVESEKLFDAADIAKCVSESNAVAAVVRKHFDSFVANEVGNRLRCGIYNGTAVNKLFDSVWTEQLDTAIKDRIRSKVYAAIDSVIAERLKGLKA